MKMYKKNKKLMLFLTLIIGIGMILTIPIDAKKYSDNSTEVVYKYIEIMNKGDFENNKDFFYKVPAGMRPIENTNYNILSLEEAEINGIIKNPEIDSTSILNEQRNFVFNSFGSDAWENVDFTLEKINAPEVKEQWIEKSTKKVISKEEGLKKLRDYWDQVGAKEGINPQELFSNKDISNGIATDEKASKLKKIKDKYEPNEPVEIQLVPYYEVYKVNLMFNGLSKAESGETNFHFYISNKNGKWSMYDGLQWNIPLEEPAGDI